MIKILKSFERGFTKSSWLDSKHTFSFGSYYDQDHMGFGVLRVINEDKVSPGQGFGAHSHLDMEIISYVLEGALEHKDSLGTGSIIEPGEIQLMRAGSGISHSEFNPSKDTPVHFLQIWILPNQKGLTPSYQQRSFQNIRKKGQLTLLASPGGDQESLTIHQDVKVSVLDISKDKSYSHSLEVDRMAWVQMTRGEIALNGHELKQGDGAAMVHGEILNFTALNDAEILVFDLSKFYNFKL